MAHDLVILFEHPEWQKPLFNALEARGIRFGKYDLKSGAFDPASLPEARLYFNQASPSAYVRGNARAVPFALALMRSLEIRGARVLNGSRAFSLELSKSAQVALMQELGVAHPKTLTFNDVDTAIDRWGDCWPALLKPEQGGSGARMYFYIPQENCGSFFVNVRISGCLIIYSYFKNMCPLILCEELCVWSSSVVNCFTPCG